VLRCFFNRNLLWVDSAGLPPFLMAGSAFKESDGVQKDGSDEIPTPLRRWVELLRELEDDKKQNSKRGQYAEASSKTLSQLLATAIGDLSDISPARSRSLVGYLVSQNGMIASTAEVLCLILRKPHYNVPKAGMASDDSDRKRSLLEHIACDVLLDNYRSDPSVQDSIRNAQHDGVDLFARCSVNHVAAKAIRLLASWSDDTHPDDSTSAVLLTILTTALWRNLALDGGSVQLLVETIMETLMSMLEAAENVRDGACRKSPASKAELDKSIKRTLTLLGEKWRDSLLTDDGPSRYAMSFNDSTSLGAVFSAVGTIMFRYPSSTLPLTFQGALLGDGISYDFDSTTGHQRSIVLNTAMSLIQVAVAELDRLQLNREGSCPESKSEGGAIFCHLAPLLFLRRVPPRLFQAAYAEVTATLSDNPLRQKLIERLQYLADHLSRRLDIRTTTTEVTVDGFAAEERQMAAEVAGRCLPFNEDPAKEKQSMCFGGATFFQHICIPAFVGTLELVSGTPGRHDDARDRIRRARAALYAACHFVPFAPGSDNECVGEALLSIASFCLQMLNAEQDRFEGSSLDNDFLQLQTGCIEYFALCVEARHSFRLSTKPSSSSNSMVAASLNILYECLFDIIQSGRLNEAERLGGGPLAQRLANNAKPNKDSNKSRAYSAPCITCLWNALIVVSQRCPDAGRGLAFLAESILPRIVALGAPKNGRISERRHHLCDTAALQLAFILITRSKSFGGIPPTASDEGASIEGLYRWSLHAIRTTQGSNDITSLGLRCAGLKVVLAVITISQEGNHSGGKNGPTSFIVSDRDRIDTFSITKEIALNDSDPKLRVLASHILSGFMGNGM
jgi:hypothetical protein